MTRGRAALGLGVSLAASFAAAGLGAVATSTSVATWYAALQKPAWTPPPWLFGPVWTVLYAAMAVAAWIVWKEAGGFARARRPLAIYLVQLALNALWSPIFFGARNPGLAVLDIVLLWVAIAATIVAFAGRSRIAAVLLVPYLVWVSYAAALNVAIWRLN